MTMVMRQINEQHEQEIQALKDQLAATKEMLKRAVDLLDNCVQYDPPPRSDIMDFIDFYNQLP